MVLKRLVESTMNVVRIGGFKVIDQVTLHLGGVAFVSNEKKCLAIEVFLNHSGYLYLGL